MTPPVFEGPSLKIKGCPAFLRLHDFAVSSRNARPESLWSSLSLAPWCPNKKWCTSEPLRWHRVKNGKISIYWFRCHLYFPNFIWMLVQGESKLSKSHRHRSHLFMFFSCEWTCFPTKLHKMSNCTKGVPASARWQGLEFRVCKHKMLSKMDQKNLWFMTSNMF